MTTKKWYIKERHNPQLNNPYYVPQGQLTKKRVKELQNGYSFGYNNYLSFDTEEEYLAEIERLQNAGFRVH